MKEVRWEIAKTRVPLHEPKSELLETGLYRGFYSRTTIGDIKEDTWSLDYGSYTLAVCKRARG